MNILVYSSDIETIQVLQSVSAMTKINFKIVDDILVMHKLARSGKFNFVIWDCGKPSSLHYHQLYVHRDEISTGNIPQILLVHKKDPIINQAGTKLNLSGILEKPVKEQGLIDHIKAYLIKIKQAKPERRLNIRVAPFKDEKAEIIIEGKGKYKIFNVSKSGIAFYNDKKPLEHGQKLEKTEVHLHNFNFNTRLQIVGSRNNFFGCKILELPQEILHDMSLYIFHRYLNDLGIKLNVFQEEVLQRKIRYTPLLVGRPDVNLKDFIINPNDAGTMGLRGVEYMMTLYKDQHTFISQSGGEPIKLKIVNEFPLKHFGFPAHMEKNYNLQKNVRIYTKKEHIYLEQE